MWNGINKRSLENKREINILKIETKDILRELARVENQKFNMAQ